MSQNNHLIKTLHSSVWDLQVSLKNGYQDKKDLPELEEAKQFLEKSSWDVKTKLRLIEARIKKLG